MVEIKVIKDKQKYDVLWNRFKGHVFQSWAWGTSRASATAGDSVTTEVVRFVYSVGGRESGIFQMIIKEYVKKLVRFGIVERVKFPMEHKEEILQEIKNKIVKELNLDFLIFEFDEENIDDYKVSDLLLNTGETNQPLHTNIIDLRYTEDELFDRIRKAQKKHRNINVAKKRGVSVKRVDANEENAQTFYNFMHKISKERGFHFLSKDHIMSVVTNLGKDNLADIFFAYVEGKIVGTYFVAYDKVRAYEFYGGVDFKGRKLFASYLLKWEAMLRAKEIGKVEYDQWGSAPKDENEQYNKDHHLYHISKFKDSLAGEYFEFAPQQVMVISKVKFQIFRVLKVLQRVKFKMGG